MNEPDGQLGTVRPQTSFSLFARAFLSDGVPPGLFQSPVKKVKSWRSQPDKMKSDRHFFQKKMLTSLIENLKEVKDFRKSQGKWNFLNYYLLHKKGQRMRFDNTSSGIHRLWNY